ncbi:MAG: aldehyde dehydrogenase family protein [Halopseudomonas sp.]
MAQAYSLIIDGQKTQGEDGTFEVINPATEQPVDVCPKASLGQLNQAVEAAKKAFASWQYSEHADRQRMLNEIADRIEQRADELARLITLEQGKPLALAHIEVGGGAAWTRATAALEVPVDIIEDGESKRIEMHRKPLGVVASITPWNWPFMIAVWHIMPALRAGNTVVSKPSSLTPLSTLLLVEIINEVVPNGVVNIVTGESGFGSAMTAHPDIQKIVFTGSTPTGQTIMRNAASSLKRLTLELGGNDAAIVLPDADVDTIAEPIFQTAFLNMGQTCAALKRLYVHDSLYDDLCAKLSDIAKQQQLGDGLDAGVTFGPIQNADQLNLVKELVDDARSQGAEILAGGHDLDGPGYFYPATIVSEISDGVRLVDEEQFGPVLPIIRYTDVEDALRRANANVNGLGGSVWSSDTDAASKVAARLECGTAWINGHAELQPHAPFGGCKMSGFGVEFGLEGLLEYTTQQVLNINK